MDSRFRFIHLAFLGPLVLLTTACSPGTSDQFHQRWDSAGVEIVENFSPIWQEGEGWTIDSVPILDLGGPEDPPKAQFYIITGAVVLPDDRVVVGHRGTNELLFFSLDGKFLEAHGGEGGGPGEFWGLYRMWLLQPDSLLVYDELERRVSIFDPHGEFIRSWNPKLPDGELVWFFPVTLMGDGSVILGTRPQDWERPRGASRDSLVYHRFDGEGNYRDSIGVFPWQETYRGTQKKADTFSSQTWIASPPFGRRSRSGPFEDGFFVGRSQVYEIDAFTPRGDLRRRIRRPEPNRPVTSQDISALKRDWLGDEPENWMQDEFGQWIANAEFPETMPSYGRILTDLEGNLWVWDYNPPGNPVDRATVFDPDGRMLGTVETPRARVVFQIGPDYLLVFIRDSMDLEHIQVFRINKE